MIELLKQIGTFVYIYCTDFVINLANLTGFSYYEINTFIFIILWPVLTVGLLLVYFMQKVRLAIALKKKKAIEQKRERVAV